jgi:hypothetical protein
LVMEPDVTLQLVLVMSDGGRYRQLLTENGVISVTIP